LSNDPVGNQTATYRKEVGRRVTAEQCQFMMSSTLTNEKTANETGRIQLNVGGVALLVLDSIFEIFSAKNRFKVTKSIQLLAGMWPRPRKLSTDFHYDRGSA